jgi:exodeoxyribonuclease V alpha subunit
MSTVASPLLLATRHWLAQAAPDLPPSLLAAIEALYLAVEEGHVCIRVDVADAAAWRDSGWVGDPGSFRPFILEPAGRFYLARYHRHEDAVAAALRARAARTLQPPHADVLRRDLDLLFGSDPQDRQRLAALLAQFRALTLVSGGPGTGKTTTVVKMLALLQAQHREQPLRILLAAPTGKAAQRLAESIRDAKQKLPLPDAVRALVPEQAQTLHRLLGAQGDTGRFRHGEDNPLPCDLLLVDEASMVDLALMQAMLAALPAEARLVLLGDRDQLASVEAGSVFGDLCAGDGMSAALAATLAPFGVAVTPLAGGNVLADCRVALTRSYRFAADSGIGALAAAARAGDAGSFLATLARDPSLVRVQPESLRTAMQAGYAAYRDAVREGDAAAAFAAFAGFRVLCAHRQGMAGVEGLNAVMEAGHAGWYAGRPVIVRANDAALRLFNGDIGLCLPTPQGLRVCFEAGEGRYRQLAPGRLPAHEPAWAMTVHQAQGSEFDEVLLVLPDTVTPVLDRPLVYTAVTRARRRFALCGSDAVTTAALATRPQVESGLVDKLG